MAKGIHKGTELANVKETWNENEKRGADESNAVTNDDATSVSNDLQQTIEEEASEYDEANKEDRLLSGERATIDDE